MKRHLTAIISLLALLAAVIGCASDETDKANTLVDEANKFVVEANKIVDEAKPKGDEFDRMVRDIDSETEHRRVSEFGKTELAPRYEKMRDNFQKAAEKFDAAAKLKVNEKFKEYLELKASEFKKRAEFSEALKAIPKTLSDSKDEREYEAAVKKDVDRVQSLVKEAEAFAQKADAIKTSNAELFKRS